MAGAPTRAAALSVAMILGVLALPGVESQPSSMRAAPAVVFATKAELAGAVAQWMRDPIAAMARYGHISDWDTRLITDMEGIFCGDSTAASKDFDATWCAEANKRFDEDISRWNTAAVKTCLLYTSPSPRDGLLSRMPSSA